MLRAHMATILERGRAIAPALSAYAEEMPAGWQRRQLIGVCRVLERGDPDEAAAALSELPECWIPLLSAATSSSDLGHVLHEFLTESRRTDDLRQKVVAHDRLPAHSLGPGDRRDDGAEHLRDS